MTENLLFPLGFLIFGILLIVMTMASSFIARLPLSAAMLYLAVGIAIGPTGLELIKPDPLVDAHLLERLTEIAVLISLFTAGQKLGVPLQDRRWRIPVQLAFLSMMLTVAMLTAVGVWALQLPLGAAILFGAILAPTDPVLASDVQISKPSDRDRVRFGLTGEAGLNDGTAFPFVMLGLGLLALHDMGTAGWRWLAFDVIWAITGALILGYFLGTGVGRTILYLRTHHREAFGSDEFIALGLIALSYGAALLCHTYGFLAVFTAGLALRRMDPTPTLPKRPEATSANLPMEAPAALMQEVQKFNTQLEHFAEVGIVLIVGAMLSTIEFRLEVLWFIPLFFLIIRPLAVYMGLVGIPMEGSQRRLIAWFGIRGIGSLYYLMYAITHGLELRLAQQMLSVTLCVVVASVIAHGISVTPLMKRYESSRAKRKAYRKKISS